MERTNFSLQQIIDKTKKKGGLVWDTPYFLNLVGIRDLSQPNTFNDTLIYYYWDKNGSLISKEVKKFTTDPGVNSLTKPVNYKGCAILCEGWHRKIWVKGKHKGQYDAFVQYAPVKVYRDNNKDSTFDLDPHSIEEGVFGINLHRANANAESTIVGGWSAGCQVVANPDDFNDLLKVRDQAIKAGQAYFSYMLFDVSDF